MYNSLKFYPSERMYPTPPSETNVISDPVPKYAEERMRYAKCIDLVEHVAKETYEVLSSYILKAATEGISYDHMKAKNDIPCCKNTYYDLYRRFFWLLSKVRQRHFAKFTNSFVKGVDDMSIKIIFNELSTNWENNIEWDLLYVKTQSHYMLDFYMVKGYLYLNTIYENLGLAWNPEEDNVCWIYKRDGELKIEFSYDAKARNIIICISKK